MAPTVKEKDFDKATVVSICPFPVNESKPGMFPSYFSFDKAEAGDFTLLVIGPSRYFQPLPATNQTVKVEIAAKDIARSIVNDFISNVLAYGENCYPGMFWVRGDYTKDEVKENFKDELKEVTEAQMNWFKAIVALADDDWKQFGQHKFINENQRTAALALGLKRDWIIENPVNNNLMNAVNCPACMSLIHPEASICPNCRSVINAAKASKFIAPVATPELVKK